MSDKVATPEEPARRVVVVFGLGPGCDSFERPIDVEDQDMGISDTVVQKQVARMQGSFIGETDTVQYAISGFGRHPVVLAGGLLGALFGKPRYLVVTDKATYLVSGAKSVKKLTPEHVIGTYPRQLDLSGFTGLYPKLEFDDGEVVYVAKPYDKPLRELFSTEG